MSNTSEGQAPSIFVSYRIADTLQTADRLAAGLRLKFGANEVFFDQRTLEAGDTWDRRIETAVKGAAVVLVLIGKKWLTEQNEYGVRRLDVPGDWVRREVEAALVKEGRIVPVFVDDAAPPPKEAFANLSSIAALSSCQGTPLRAREWDTDFGALVDLLASKGLHVLTDRASSQNDEVFDRLFDRLAKVRPEDCLTIVEQCMEQAGYNLENDPTRSLKSAVHWYKETFHDAGVDSDEWKSRMAIKKYLDQLENWARQLDAGSLDAQILFDVLNPALPIDINLIKVAIAAHQEAHKKNPPYTNIRHLWDAFTKSKVSDGS
jgi:hypothetical protein